MAFYDESWEGKAPVSIHGTAMHHLRKAKVLIERNSDDDVRYAALEMRFCIEHLFYRFIPIFKQELPDDVVTGKIWRPAEVIDMIADIDPTVQHDAVISFGLEPSPGVAPKQMVVLGRQSGISKDLVRKIYHKLGFYLHARVDQKPHDLAKLRRHLVKFLPHLEKFEGDSAIGSGVAERVTFKCTECGRPIAKRTEHIKRQPLVKCPNSRCGAIYEHVETKDGASAHRMLQHNVKCPKCQGDNWFGVHKLERGAADEAIIACRECNAEYRLHRYVMIQPVIQETQTEATSE